MRNDQSGFNRKTISPLKVEDNNIETIFFRQSKDVSEIACMRGRFDLSPNSVQKDKTDDMGRKLYVLGKGFTGRRYYEPVKEE